MQWLIKIKRPTTLKDMESGICGAFISKSIIVEGKSKNEAKRNAKIEEGFKIDSIDNWTYLQEKTMLDNIKWIMAH